MRAQRRPVAAPRRACQRPTGLDRGTKLGRATRPTKSDTRQQAHTLARRPIGAPRLSPDTPKAPPARSVLLSPTGPAAPLAWCPAGALARRGCRSVQLARLQWGRAISIWPASSSWPLPPGAGAIRPGPAPGAPSFLAWPPPAPPSGPARRALDARPLLRMRISGPALGARPPGPPGVRRPAAQGDFAPSPAPVFSMCVEAPDARQARAAALLNFEK